jgi:probable phosphoglycerate mutase
MTGRTSVRIFLARHGETEWNAVGKLQGHTDVPLNEAGLAQAAALAEALKAEGVRRVITSDLSRARQTGVVVASRLGLEPPHVDPDLRERRFGKFEGLTYDECAVRYPDEWRAWSEHAAPPPGGEPRDAVVARMGDALRAVTSRVEANAQTGPALVVSHGGAMRLWLTYGMGLTVPRIGNGTVYLLVQDEQGLRASPW